MTQGCVIQREESETFVERDPGQILRVPPQVLRQIMQRSSRRAGCGVFAFKPNPSSEATLRWSRTVNTAVSGAKVQSS